VSDSSVPTRVLALADRLAAVDGVVAVTLGGSRARGVHRTDSDVDLGLYYRGELDVGALRRLAAGTADEVTGVHAPGDWGPWVDGGAWLVFDGLQVDWIYRDLDRVRRIWADCRAGRYEIGFQPGHPLGFYSHAYAGELALGRLLADPTGEAAALQAAARDYPPALSRALVAGAWEAGFAVTQAGYGARGVDPAYAAGCLFRAVGVLAQALHGWRRSWVVNEKRLVESAGALPGAPDGFAARAHRLLGRVGTTGAELAATVTAARQLVDETVGGLPAENG
jgi:hypothetical protein